MGVLFINIVQAKYDYFYFLPQAFNSEAFGATRSFYNNRAFFHVSLLWRNFCTNTRNIKYNITKLKCSVDAVLILKNIAVCFNRTFRTLKT